MFDLITLNLSEKVAQYIKKHPEAVNTPHEWSETPLIYAIKANQLEIVKILVAAGADLQIKNVLNRSALDYVAEKKDPALYEAIGCEKPQIIASAKPGI